ncbi:hypothetical protein LCGC14_0971220 [marine sediment metagenome]|uniref:Uncharacterized protein n=1 Tax=marine sediment metagenome TaxID=412755 RepID=A0A0F9NXV1_9ZZZZ
MVKIQIRKTPNEEEWQVIWRENGKKDEGKTSYHGDPEDAVYTAIDNIERYPNADLSTDHITGTIVSRYRPDFLIRLAREAAQRVTGEG